MDLTSTLLKVSNATTVEELWAIYTDTMRAHGFDRIIYGRTRFRNGYNLGDPSDYLVLSNQDPAYLEYFVDQKRFADSPMFRWSFDHVGCASWSLAAERAARGELTAKEIEVVEGNQQFGVVAGYTISFPSHLSYRTKASASLTAAPGITQAEVDEIWAKCGAELEVLSYVFDLKIASLPHFTHQISLTKRQREVLEWIADGKTVQDTAVILNLTPATVEKHLRLAREALHVETTAQAVLKAAFMNQIFMVEG
jgi:LuxR family transcriptional regulator